MLGFLIISFDTMEKSTLFLLNLPPLFWLFIIFPPSLLNITTFYEIVNKINLFYRYICPKNILLISLTDESKNNIINYHTDLEVLMFQYYKFFDYLRKNKITQKELFNNKIVSMGTMQRLRDNEYVNTAVLDKLCNYLKCDITDIMEYIPSTEEETNKE